MIRRRRPTREIHFSFDSFLDVVANVVGIIIRLILVVWVGARSYASLHPTRGDAPPAQAAVIEAPLTDPLQDELAQERRDLAEAQARLLEQLRQVQHLQAGQAGFDAQLAALTARRQGLEQELAAFDRAAGERGRAADAVALTAAELRQRVRTLVEQIHEIEKLPPLKKTFRYQTPVSRPVQSEELLFECKAGRVTFIDIGTLLREVRSGIRDRGEQLRSRWQVEDVAGPAGAFRMRYLVERERGLLDAALDTGKPDSGDFRYGVTRWLLEPVSPLRGEPVEEALRPGSEFRRIVDALDSQQTVVTFFVYPDSFADYRRVRDYLYERDIVVAGRPLPEGMPIASSRNGSRSRGQ